MWIHSSLRMQECRDESEIYNYTCTNRFNFWIINSFMEYWGIRLTWLDCKPSGSKSTLYKVALAILINKLRGNISAVFFFIPVQWEIHLKSCQILFRLVYLWILSIFILLALLVDLEHGKLCLLFHCLLEFVWEVNL